MLGRIRNKVKLIISNKVGLMMIAINIIFQILLVWGLNVFASNFFMSIFIYLVITFIQSEIVLWFVVKKNVIRRFASVCNYFYNNMALNREEAGKLSCDSYLFSYNAFYHFELKPSQKLLTQERDINRIGFRSERDLSLGGIENNVYLAGDCKFFERCFTSMEDIYAHKLEAKLSENLGKPVNVLNAGVPHYTMLHSLNRMVIDLNRIPFKKIVLSAGINDVLVFLHHKNGSVSPDYKNLYVPFNEKQLKDEFTKSWITRKSMIAKFYKYYKYNRQFSFNCAVEAVNDDYNTEASVQIARSLFNSTYFETYLRSFIGVCSAHDIELVLINVNYKTDDMTGPARSFIKYGIDQINHVMEKVAKQYHVPLFDLQNVFSSEEKNIVNKWHHTEAGNDLRVELTHDFIFNNFFRRSDSVSK